MKTMGGFLVIVSIVVWFFSVRMDLNEMNMSFEIVRSSQLIQKQLIYTNAAGVLFLAGIFLFGIGAIGDLIDIRLTSIDEKIPKIPPSV